MCQALGSVVAEPFVYKPAVYRGCFINILGDYSPVREEPGLDQARNLTGPCLRQLPFVLCE